MATKSKMTAAEVTQKLKSITEYVRDCQTRVRKGEIMDLAGLDQNVVDICDAVAALPKEEAKDLEKQMMTLIDNLEDLGDVMKEHQERITGRPVDDFGGK